jgi:hypothetical protein
MRMSTLSWYLMLAIYQPYLEIFHFRDSELVYYGELLATLRNDHSLNRMHVTIMDLEVNGLTAMMLLFRVWGCLGVQGIGTLFRRNEMMDPSLEDKVIDRYHIQEHSYSLD